MTNEINHASFAHIAPGPYRFVGYESEDMRAERKAHELASATDFVVQTDNMCGGTCDHCGTPIFDVYFFRAADGTKFKVGCECAEKALSGEDDARALASFRATKRKIDSKKRKALAEKKDAAAREWLTEHMSELANLPSPNATQAARGVTAEDWATWMLANAGKAGVQKTVKVARALLA